MGGQPLTRALHRMIPGAVLSVRDDSASREPEQEWSRSSIVLDVQALRQDPRTGRLCMQSLGPAKTREIESALCSRLRR